MLSRLLVIIHIAVLGASFLDTLPRAAAAEQGLIAYWSFDDGTARDNSGNGFDGTIIGNATVTLGISGKALHFDGDGFISVAGDELGMTRSTERTISLWANPSSLPGDGVGLISKYHHFDVAGSNYYASMFLDNGHVVTLLTGQGTDGLYVPAGELGKWQHFVFVMKDGVGESKVYVNGILAGQGTLTYNDAISSEPLRIANIVGAGQATFHGVLDEIRIYDRVLTESEIRDLFLAVVPVSIDIKPGSFPNRINPKSRGIIPVAVLSTNRFDATIVDPGSVKFGPKGATIAHGQSHIEDVDRDGDLDLVLHFRTQETGIRCRDTSAPLTGQTFDGQVITGADSIKTLGCNIKPGLIAYWSFDDGTARDDSGNGFDGAIIGNPAVIPGIVGKALQFDGNSFISVVGDELGMTRSIERTISLGATPSSLPGNTGLISKYQHFDVAESNYYASMFLDNGQVVTVLTGQGTDGLFVTAGQIGKWQHFVFVMKDGVGESKVYINGVLVGQGTLTYNAAISSEPLRIGNTVGADQQTFHGALDEIRIYDRVLTENEIRALSLTGSTHKH
jgi:hypothetical protein